MKFGDRVIWFRSPGRSILSGWKVQKVPGIIVRICRRRIGILVSVNGKQRVANVNPENLIWDDEAEP